MHPLLGMVISDTRQLFETQKASPTKSFSTVSQKNFKRKKVITLFHA